MRLLALAAILHLGGGIAHADVVDDAVGGRIGGGTAGEAVVALQDALAANPADNRTRFALGAMQALHGWELLAQDLYRYGAGVPLRQAASFLLPPLAVLPANPEPEEVTLDDLEATILGAMEHLRRAERTLAEMGEEEFTLRVNVLGLRLDIDGDGRATDRETIASLLETAQVRLRSADGVVVDVLEVDFDRGDAEWLRGYCHLALALDEWALAHDWTSVFERTGHVLFPRAKTEYAFLRGPRSPFRAERRDLGVDPIDLVAAVHLMRLPVDEPERMGACREHLLAAIGRSRAMWAYYNDETDQGAEWIPNPAQEASLSGVRVDSEEQLAWLAFLNDAQAMLEGELLLPFWRGDGSTGINVRRVFEEPREFDLVLWIQGSAAAAYLEEGEIGSRKTWDDLQRAFERHSFRHMFWFN